MHEQKTKPQKSTLQSTEFLKYAFLKTEFTVLNFIVWQQKLWSVQILIQYFTCVIKYESISYIKVFKRIYFYIVSEKIFVTPQTIFYKYIIRLSTLFSISNDTHEIILVTPRYKYPCLLHKEKCGGVNSLVSIWTERLWSIIMIYIAPESYCTDEWGKDFKIEGN